MNNSSAKEDQMKSRIVILGIVFCLLLFGSGFAQVKRSAEVETLLTGLNSPSSSQRINASKLISRSGLTDQKLYAKVAILLKDGYAAKTDANHIDEMAWLCKALAASGDSQYRPLFEEIIDNSPSTKLQRYAEQSHALIEEYAQRSQVLNETESWDESLSAEDNRLVNMLNSDNLALKRDAAKMIVRSTNPDEKVFDTAAAALTTMATESRSESTYIDTMAWLCKSLAASGNSKYVETLQHVHDNTSSTKLKTYASKALKNF